MEKAARAPGHTQDVRPKTRGPPSCALEEIHSSCRAGRTALAPGEVKEHIAATEQWEMSFPLAHRGSR